ncbi:hypothetical protein M422DRAFT_39720 [Sphaerobolus stellatus SS14]|uniref:Uncharacterized protein n=1 Tax=Sphaerobolus stellatus (strain SS14) TaxID=990650 RepID=A0A0C9UDK1_SPHS4|nr:hypothetical protein M422DRAFT_39720 [Sphaerobolus stellatus SS14]
MILLQILDEGSLTDSQGRKVDFKVYGNVTDFAKASVLDIATHHFTEFINCIDSQIVFNRLSKKNNRSITSLKLNEVMED